MQRSAKRDHLSRSRDRVVTFANPEIRRTPSRWVRGLSAVYGQVEAPIGAASSLWGAVDPKWLGQAHVDEPQRKVG